MWIFQTALVIFFFFALVKVWAKYRVKEVTKFTAFVWSGVWILAGAIVVWPNSTAILAKRLGFGRGVDMVIYVSIAVLFFVVFKQATKIEHLNRDITVLTRKVALEEKKGE